MLDEDGHPEDVIGPFTAEKEQQIVEGVLRKYPAVLGEEGNGTIIRMAFRHGRGVATHYTAGWMDRLRHRVRPKEGQTAGQA